MLNAAEAAIDANAADDKERAKNRARLYAPPKGVRAAQGRRRLPPGMQMTRGNANALLAQAAAQEAEATRGGSG